MRIWGVLLCLALAVTTAVAADQLSNRRAPGFSLPDLNLKQYDLADYRGKVVLIDFMKTDCPHCQTVSRLLEDVKAKYGLKVAILSIVTPPDNQQTAIRYIQANFLSTPILFDCSQVAISYLKVTPENPKVELPHLFVIDGQGMIRHDYKFEADRPVFEDKGLLKVLDGMLAGGGTPKKP